MPSGKENSHKADSTHPPSNPTSSINNNENRYPAETQLLSRAIAEEETTI